jgi:hypothetical protein
MGRGDLQPVASRSKSTSNVRRQGSRTLPGMMRYAKSLSGNPTPTLLTRVGCFWNHAPHPLNPRLGTGHSHPTHSLTLVEARGKPEGKWAILRRTETQLTPYYKQGVVCQEKTYPCTPPLSLRRRTGKLLRIRLRIDTKFKAGSAARITPFVSSPPCCGRVFYGDEGRAACATLPAPTQWVIQRWGIRRSVMI